MFDSSGRWYGKGKCGIGIEMFDCLIVSASFSGRRVVEDGQRREKNAN